MTAPRPKLEQAAVTKLASTLEMKGVPAPRAALKAESTVVGKQLAYGGFALILVAAGLVALVDLTWQATIGVGMIGVLGFAVLVIALPMISLEAAPMIDKVCQWILNLVRAVRGTKGEG